MFKKLFGWKTAASQDIATRRDAVAPEMRYCPDCGDEYRAEIRQCASCNIPLISEAEKREQLRLGDRAFDGRSMDITAQDQRVAIRQGKLRDLKPLRMLLTQERIPTLLSGASAGSKG